jgi:hypothetical protein
MPAQQRLWPELKARPDDRKPGANAKGQSPSPRGPIREAEEIAAAT